MTNLFKIDEDCPSEIEQRQIIYEFREIVVNQLTSEHKLWLPQAILSDMWSCWEKKPIGAGNEERFRDEFTRTVSNLRSGVSKYYVNNALIYFLIESFVYRHAPRGKPVLSGRDIRVVNNTADAIDEFHFGSVLRDCLGQEDPAATINSVDSRSTRYLRLKPKISVFKLVSAFYSGYKNNFLVRDSDQLKAEPETDDSYPYHPLEGLLLFVGDFNKEYWKVVLFDPLIAKFEIGFWSVETSSIYLRSIAVNPLLSYSTYHSSHKTRVFPTVSTRKFDSLIDPVVSTISGSPIRPVQNETICVDNSRPMPTPTYHYFLHYDSSRENRALATKYLKLFD